MELKKIFRSVKTGLMKHSPEILVGVGIAGMVTTVVLAVRATPKAMQLIEEEKPETPVEYVKAAWKPYIPAAATGLFSAACIIGANSVNLKRNAALATACSLSETALREYRKKVVETVGEKKEQEVRDALAKEKLQKAPKNTEVSILPNKTLCYDAVSGRYFQSDIEKIRKAVNALNRQIVEEMYISLNEFYYEIGLNQITLGDVLGWNIDDGLIEVMFSSQLAENDIPCLVIDFNVFPRYDYASLH